jgi:hypothetical protein
VKCPNSSTKILHEIKKDGLVNYMSIPSKYIHLIHEAIKYTKLVARGIGKLPN